MSARSCTQCLQSVTKCHDVSRQVASECSCTCTGMRNQTKRLVNVAKNNTPKGKLQ